MFFVFLHQITLHIKLTCEPPCFFFFFFPRIWKMIVVNFAEKEREEMKKKKSPRFFDDEGKSERENDDLMLVVVELANRNAGNRNFLWLLYGNECVVYLFLCIFVTFAYFFLGKNHNKNENKTFFFIF